MGGARPTSTEERELDREELIRLVLEDPELRKALAKTMAHAIEHDYPLRDAVHRAIKRERQLKSAGAREGGRR
jgi:hypothetical protein